MPQIKLNASVKKGFAVFAAALLLGLGIGYGLRGKPAPPGAHTPAAAPEEAARVKDAENPDQAGLPGAWVYVCPMNCVPPMEKPGKCPVCGMDLVAASAQEHRGEKNWPRVTLTEETVKAAGIQVAPVEKRAVTAEIRLFGKIEYDPVHQYKVTAFAPGVIDRIYVKRAGQTVRAGDPLFDMHSSELFVIEQDLFDVLKEFPDVVDYRPARGQVYRRQMRPPRRQFDLPQPGEDSPEVVAAKQAALEKLNQIQRKMKLLGLPNEEIERIMARGLPSGISTVITPTTGVVLEQLAFKGSYVNTGEAVFTIANPQYVWAKFDAYASDFPWIRLGQEAEFRSDAYPGEVFRGKVIYLDPYFDEKTRTFKVGVLCSDHQQKLKPAMLVRGVVYAALASPHRADAGEHSASQASLVIPDTAPLITGKRAVVYVEVPGKPGTYQGREIFLGPRAKGYYQVMEGLHEGEKVVVNGSFKIDSAVQILAKPSMMEGPGGGPQAMPMAPAVPKPAGGRLEEGSSGKTQRRDLRDLRLKRMEEIRRTAREGRAPAPSASSEKEPEQ